MELSLMLTIVDEEQTEKISRFLRRHLVRFQYVSPAFGTANSELMALLGLGETAKSVVISLVPKHQAKILARDIPKHITLGKRTKGLLMTLHLSSVCNSLLGSFNPEFLLKFYKELNPSGHSHLLEMLKIKPEELTAEFLNERLLKMETEIEKPDIDDVVKHELIVAVVGRDTSEELMEAAKTAGASGGTVVNARRVGLDDDNTFMGMPIQVNKEIILILTERGKKVPIMKAISHGFGLNTPAHGLIFSMPVDSVAWIE